MLFVGDDWAEDHQDVEVQDETGRRLGKARLPEGVAGLGRLHALVGEHLGQDSGPQQVAVGIETDRGPWVAAVVAAGYQVYAINPLQGGTARRIRSPAPRATPGTRTRWPTWSVPTGASCGRWPATAAAARR